MGRLLCFTYDKDVMPKITASDIDIYVRPFEEGDIQNLVPRLRDSDVLELAAIMGPGKTTEECVQESVDASKEIYCLILDGKNIAVWGVADSQIVDNFGIPWLVASPEIEDIYVKIVRYSRDWVEHISRDYEGLYNFVHVPHWQSQKWLQMCGFDIVTQLTYGFNEEEFYLFLKECS